jgi:hypothetical protein
LHRMAAVAAQPTWRADYGDLAMEAVDRLVEAPALAELPLAEQVELRVHAMYIRRFLSLPAEPELNGSLVDATDFPIFVADLIRGTFDAIVDLTTEQVDAFVALLKDLSDSVDGYRREAEHDCVRELQQAAAETLLSEIHRIARAA